jgi:hypothetical protein
MDVQLKANSMNPNNNSAACDVDATTTTGFLQCTMRFGRNEEHMFPALTQRDDPKVSRNKQKMQRTSKVPKRPDIRRHRATDSMPMLLKVSPL